MSSLSFVSSVAARPVAAPARAARKAVSTEVKAIGGFGPNMPADEYRQKMEAKKALIAANKAKAASKKGGSAALFGFGKKKEAEAPPAKKGFGFGGKAKAAAAPAKKPTRFGANLPGRRKEPLEEKKKAFSLFGK